jgi:hypothetical protein
VKWICQEGQDDKPWVIAEKFKQKFSCKMWWKEAHTDEGDISRLGSACSTLWRIRSVIREYFKSKATMLAFALTWDDKYV